MHYSEILIYVGIFFSLYLANFIFLTFLENKERVFESKKIKNFPLVSLIIPCYNEAKNIERVLRSLLNLDYPKNKLEIIVVDDGSKDETFAKAAKIAKESKIIKVFQKKNGGKYTALNYGLKRAQGRFIGSIDADCYVEKTALKKALGYFKDPKTMVVTSTIKIAKPNTVLEGVQYVEFLIAAFLRKIFSFLDSVTVTPGPLSIFRKEVFETLGPYKKGHQAEDLEMAFRLQNANFKIAHAVEAIVYTFGEPKLKGLFLQRLRWRRGFLLNLGDYPQLLDFRKHGNLSFLFFCNIFGAFLSISLVSYALFKLLASFLEKTQQFLVAGFNFSFPNLSWFSLNTKPTFILGILSLTVFLIYLMLGKILTCDKSKLKGKTISYLVIYAFLNASWWVSAFASILFKKELKWK
ncbi:glycosyltransferase family 2 protein [bacterium]|nr:glycosyltransferase family 2 protein [bacterium]